MACLDEGGGRVGGAGVWVGSRQDYNRVRTGLEQMQVRLRGGSWYREGVGVGA